MSSSLTTLQAYLLSSVGFLGAFSRFTHDIYTPQWYAIQEYHAPDDGSTIAMITPHLDPSKPPCSIKPSKFPFQE
ncbi:hypothetical protein BJX76DRAFT_358009 [Aspergillus varians]